MRAKNRNRILFYAGFVARDDFGNRTTLGRDGSNVTAIALAAAIKTNEAIYIYSDTDGVLIADPRIIGEAQTARYLSYKEASLLAQWGGMKALQENSLYILNLKGTHIPINIRNSFKPQDSGTLLTHVSNDSNSVVKGIGIIPNVMYWEFRLSTPEYAYRIEEALNGYEGAKVLISRSENRGGKFISGFVVQTDPKKAERNREYYESGLEEWIRQTAFDGGKLPENYFKLKHGSLITVCGEGLGNSHSDRSKIESILAGLQIPANIKEGIYHLPTIVDKDLIQVVVERENTNDVAKAVYNELKRINIVLYGLGNVGTEFLKRVREQYDKLGLNVVAVADTSGIYAKPGGFSAEELKRVIEMKSSGISAERMTAAEGALHLSKRNGNLASVYEMGKGDFVLVDATPDPSTFSTLLHAVELGSRVISVNKTPYTVQPNRYDGSGSNLEKFADENVRKLYKSMMEQGVFNRGTVGADLGVPGTLLEILAKNPAYVTAIGCMSGTLGYTCSSLDKGMSLSEAVGSAVAQRIAEPTPFTDYSGLDVLNKTTILWRTIATKYGLSFFDCDINYERFIDQAVKRYEENSGQRFDTTGLEKLRGNEFTERINILDESFAQLRAEAGVDKVFRYVGEITYNSETRRYSLDVRLKAVHKESVLGSLDGTENMFLFGINGPPRKSYGIEPGPGAGVSQTANAIMHDLLQINGIIRGMSKAASIQTQKYKPTALSRPQSDHYHHSSRVALPQLF